MKLKLPALMFSWIFAFNVFAGISIVSDLDDTIKITNSGNIADASYRGVFKSAVFAGMPELLKATRQYTNELHIVTASPNLIRSQVMKTLNKYEIKYESLSMRSLRNRQDKYTYKVARIKEIMEQNSDDFIFLGDDVGQDPEVYVEMARLYPNRVLGSYIHVINNRDLPQGVIKVYTAHDMAILEHASGRMGDASALEVINRVSNEKSLTMLIPGFAYCPIGMTDTWASQMGTIFAQDSYVLFRKISEYCRSRDSKVQTNAPELAEAY